MDALVIGEALVDLVERDGVVLAYPGGSAANAAVALSRLGRGVRLWTSYAEDEHGMAIDRHLAAAGVTLAADPHLLPRTPTAAALIGPTGAATYRFDVAWRLGALPALSETRFVHVCSWGPVLRPGAERVLELIAATSVPVTYDINVRPALTGAGPALTAAVEETARHAQLIKASDEDLAVLYPDLALGEAAAHVRSLGPSAVVVTEGAQGATWFGAETVHVPASPVLVADTIGAGDTFGAALLDALWDLDLATVSTDQIRTVLRHATRAAAITVSRPGADPPYRFEIEA